LHFGSAQKQFVALDPDARNFGNAEKLFVALDPDARNFGGTPPPGADETRGTGELERNQITRTSILTAFGKCRFDSIHPD
jgi:hypothetical protein